MGKFETDLDYIFLSERQIELIKPLIWAGNGEIIIVPAGFKSDGLSVPKWAQWFQDPFGFGLEAGILHDFVLESEDIEMSFLEANDLFDDALKSLGMGWLKRNILELACDLNGIVVHGNEKPNNWEENQNG